MTNAELEFMKLVPIRLKEIAEQLKELNETIKNVSSNKS